MDADDPMEEHWLPPDASPEAPRPGLRWPPIARRWQLVRNMERYLAIGDRTWKFVGWAQARSRRRVARPLPPPFLRVVRHLAGEDLGEIDGATARELWGRVRALAGPIVRRQPGLVHLVDPDRLSGWQTLELCAIALAEGMSYPGAASRDDDDAPWDPEPRPAGVVARAVGRLIGRERVRAALRRVEPLELLAMSLVHAVRLDVRSLGWLIRQPFERGLVGLCRHYSMLVRALFHAAKLATGRHQRVHVVEVGGYAAFHHPFGHAWNWFVDERSDRIVAFDLTGADWLLDRRRAATIFNPGFDGARWNNTSSFLCQLMLLHGDGAVPAPVRDDAAELFGRLIDPTSERGQALLLNLAQQAEIAREVRGRIAGFLAQEGWNLWFPGWRARLRAAEESLLGRIGRLGREPAWQHALLDSAGVPRDPAAW